MRKRSRLGRRRASGEGRQPRSYLRRLTPMALMFLPFWLLLPYVVRPDRIALIFSESVATWRLLLMAAFAILASYASSACLAWGDSRKEGRPR